MRQMIVRRPYHAEPLAAPMSQQHAETTSITAPMSQQHGDIAEVIRSCQLPLHEVIRQAQSLVQEGEVLIEVHERITIYEEW